MEALIVVTIIGALLAVSLPRFRGTFDNLRFQNFYQDLLSRMSYLKERASVEQHVYRLTFDVESHRVLVSSKADVAEETFGSVSGRFGKAMPIPDGVEIDTDSLEIFFFPDGSIAGNDIILRDSHNSVTLKINKSLGRFSLQTDNSVE